MTERPRVAKPGAPLDPPSCDRVVTHTFRCTRSADHDGQCNHEASTTPGTPETNEVHEFCPMHSADAMVKAVRQNRVLLELEPQPCICRPAPGAPETEALGTLVPEDQGPCRCFQFPHERGDRDAPCRHSLTADEEELFSVVRRFTADTKEKRDWPRIADEQAVRITLALATRDAAQRAAGRAEAVREAGEFCSRSGGCIR